MSSARLSPAQIRVANANRWFLTHRFPESKVINGLLLHQRTDFRVKLRENIKPSGDKATGIYPAADAIGTIEKNPIGRGQIATAENFKEVSQDPEGLFSSLAAQGLFDAEGKAPDAIYEPEALKALDPGVAGVMRLIKGNAYFLNYDILLGAARAENPIGLFETLDKLVGRHFMHGDPDNASSMWSGRLRYGLLSTILSAERASIEPHLLMSSMNEWMGAEENRLYTDAQDSPRTIHSFMFGASAELQKPSILPVVERKINEQAIGLFHRIAVPSAYMTSPVKFLDWSGKLLASRHRPCLDTGVVGKFWNHSAQVDLFLHVLRNADFIESPVLLDK
jgi:hypothetical protein